MISTYDVFLVVAAVLTNTSVIFFFWGMNKRHACCGEVRLICVFWSTALWWQRVCVLTQVMSGLLMEHSAKYLEEDLSCYQTPLGEFQISSAVLAEGWGREGGGEGWGSLFSNMWVSHLGGKRWCMNVNNSEAWGLAASLSFLHHSRHTTPQIKHILLQRGLPSDLV